MSGLGDLLRAGARDRLLVEAMEKFVDAYDAWTVSLEQCEGVMFARMEDARSDLRFIAPLLAEGDK